MNNYYVIGKNINHYVTKYSKYVLRDPGFYEEDEGYKYQAVATFQKHFDLNAKDIVAMLDHALKDMVNLIQSGQYFPKQMLMRYAQEDPEFIRNALKSLLNEDRKVEIRIDEFIGTVEKRFVVKSKKSYFDYRFVGVLLAVYNPEEYIAVKYKEFKKFAHIVGYDINISGTNGEKYTSFYRFAKFVRSVLRNNNEFIKVHNRITTPFDYKDKSLSWGTTDFIFNVSRHLDSDFNREAEAVIQQNLDIQTSKEEELEDMLVDDEIVEIETARYRDDVIELAKKYIPHGNAYVEKEGKYTVRQDSAAQKERIKILENYSCQICGISFEYINANGKKKQYIHADHIIDKHKGGTEKLHNLWILCPNCHTKKTLGIITIDTDEERICEKGTEIFLHHDNHLFKKL